MSLKVDATKELVAIVLGQPNALDRGPHVERRCALFVDLLLSAVKEDMTPQKGVDEVVICWCWDDVGGHVKLCPVIREVDVQKELVRFEAGVFLRTYKDRQGTWHYVQTYPDGQDMPSRVEDSGA